MSCLYIVEINPLLVASFAVLELFCFQFPVFLSSFHKSRLTYLHTFHSLSISRTHLCHLSAFLQPSLWPPLLLSGMPSLVSQVTQFLWVSFSIPPSLWHLLTSLQPAVLRSLLNSSGIYYSYPSSITHKCPCIRSSSELLSSASYVSGVLLCSGW